jgi:hypothetical protein
MLPNIQVRTDHSVTVRIFTSMLGFTEHLFVEWQRKRPEGSLHRLKR